jgi:glycosyltransferase involved in cell wall biosynthesis
LAVRNGERFLTQTIESIVGQSSDDWELVIVDDASVDATGDIVKGFGRRDPRIRTFRRDVPAGPYVAANMGLAEARGRYIVRTDADDVSLPHRLQAQVAYLDANPGLRACTCGWRTIDQDGRPSDDGSWPPRGSPAVLRWAICVVSGFVHSTLCIERSALESLGGYRELPLAADYGLWCEAARRGWLGVTPSVLVEWRRHAEQLSTSRFDEQRAVCVGFASEHLARLTGEPWSLADTETLWGPGRWLPTDLRPGFAALARWERAWRRDKGLRLSDRFELARLTLRLRARHARLNANGDFTEAIRGLAGLVRPRQVGDSSQETTMRP